MDTGQRTYSGTGRNARTTRLVEPYSNYHAIPATLAPVATSGTSMKLSARGAEVLGPYWTEFESVSSYEVILTEPRVPASVLTRAGDKVVGAIYRSKSSTGTLLLLPHIDFYADAFVQGRGKNAEWTPAAKKFAAKMISAVGALNRALRSKAEVTPEPKWASEPKFALSLEASLKVRLLEAERDVEEAQRKKEQLVDELRAARFYRGLLYEKGRALENVVIAALRLLGFSAERFKESDSEFDVVFESAEGRLIGEAEGKDSKAVNVDKLRQLSMNMHEDLEREDVTGPAKPVLFGNAFRLQPLAERPDPFTDKCRSAAANTSTALVFTPDLFWPVQHLAANPDSEYARACRLAMLNSVGRVAFPAPPAHEQLDGEATTEEMQS